MEDILKDIQVLLNGTAKQKLPIILKMTQDRLKVLLKSQEIPSQFEYLVKDVSLKRFNRLGNEGMQSYSQEGLSMAFPDSDFDEYAGEISNYLKVNDPDSMPRRSAARFY